VSTEPPSGRLTLLLGGVRSGKSARALALAEPRLTAGGRALFVATAQAFDDEMARRIAAHRAERSGTWHTLESPLDLPADLVRTLVAEPRYAVVLIDCLTLWVSNVLLSLGDDDDAEAIVGDRTRALLSARTVKPDVPWVVVSNEVGLGVVPPTPLGRRYRDALGRANQLVAAAADDVTLMVAGLELAIKRGAS
jgi:adenosylcobinamide kinase/adenosylcobinamide-phosphate guanylyltransferase